MEIQKNKSNYGNWKERDKAGSLAILHEKFYYKTVLIETVWYRCKGR